MNTRYQFIFPFLYLISITPFPSTLRKLYFHFLSNWMGYDRRDSFPFDFEPNGLLFGSKSKGKLSTWSYPIQYERKWKTSFLSVATGKPHHLYFFYESFRLITHWWPTLNPSVAYLQVIIGGFDGGPKCRPPDAERQLEVLIKAVVAIPPGPENTPLLPRPWGNFCTDSSRVTQWCPRIWHLSQICVDNSILLSSSK